MLAAVFSGAFSFFAMFFIGKFTLLLTCLQLAAAVAVRFSVRGLGWAVPLLLGTAVWIALVRLI